MEYNFREIEKKWQQYWKDNQTYKVTEKEGKKKFYVLDMFPYPSGAGLHVGHPLGYIASDIYSRFKRLKGFNVLHPMGYDAYGLPAEQYAIQTGQHPAITTEKNINRYREQLDKIGFCYDWSREIRTCDPEYYKWTQWAFEKMFNSFYSYDEQKALPIETLTKIFETSGTEGLNVACSEELSFTADEWKKMSVKEQQKTLLNYRIAYLGDTMVNWCPQLGTVLANDEVSEGLSVRGGYPVEQKIMRQWCLRVSAYAQRLLDGLDTIDWSESLKETQRNWIGRSEGAEMKFKVVESDVEFTIFTTRADTIFGVTFMVLAPESDYVAQVTTPEQKKEVDAYLDSIKHRTERERLMDRSVSGVFSGAYAINPLNNEKIPIWISDYVLAGYGTGAIMAVPAHDSRDYAFAKHFGLPIIPEEIPVKHKRISDIVQAKYKLKVLKYNSIKKIVKDYGRKIFELINQAYADLYGYSALSEKQIDYYVKMYVPMVRLENVSLIVNEKEELVGVGIAIPSMTKALQKAKGKLFPFGFIHILKALRGKNDVVDLLLVALRPDYQNTGANALLFSDLIPVFIKNGYKYAESNPELEENGKVQSQWQYFENVQHKRRRAYKKRL